MTSMRTRSTRNRLEPRRRATEIVNHRLRPHGEGQLDILVQYSSYSSRRRPLHHQQWIPHKEAHRHHYDLLMRYWRAFPGGIAGELATLFLGRADIPHFPARIVQIEARSSSSRDPAIAVVDWVGWPECGYTAEPLHQIAKDAPELLDEYCRRHATIAVTPCPKSSQLATRIRSAKSIVVVTGAGISVSAGLPTFAALRSQFGQNAFLATALAAESFTSLSHDMVRYLY
ncbi:hypothetical protein F4782DRAFT_535988 [Xylaria castorea]|nr:hypothetical protein F4782DRAFT_535988 [Xylaria castorea]